MSFYRWTALAKPASDCYDAIFQELSSRGIGSDLTMVGAMATINVETARTFRAIAEYASGVAYEGRVDLGNVNVGDGVKYKGRGFIQLTGRANYNHYGQVLGIDLVNHPELALQTDVAAKIFAQYFKDRACNVACDNQDWVQARKLVNGGLNGYDRFWKVVSDYLK